MRGGNERQMRGGKRVRVSRREEMKGEEMES